MDDVEEDGVADGRLELGKARRDVEVDEVADVHVGVRVGTLTPDARVVCRDECRQRRAPRELGLGRRDGRPWGAVRLLALALVIGGVLVLVPVGVIVP